MTVRGIYEWSRRYINLPLLLVLAFVAYVFFINDENSLVDRMHYEERIRELRAEIQENRDSMEYFRDLNKALDTDRATIERIVREFYHMQRPDEDVYIFEDEQ